MYRVHLTEAHRAALQRRTRDRKTLPRTRDRLEMVRLADAGWSIPKIAVHLRLSEKRVRSWIKQFLTGGFDALPDQPHVGQQSRLTPLLVAALRQSVAQSQRTWTARQLADWLAEQHGVRLTLNHLARRLKQARFSYQRTKRGLQHKQDREKVAERQADLETAERGARPVGWASVCHVDEAGFALTLPTSRSWGPVGVPLRVPYEAPQGRRLNVIGGYFSHGPQAGTFEFASFASLPRSRSKNAEKTRAQRAAAQDLTVEDLGVIDSAVFLGFVWYLAGRPVDAPEDGRRERPLVVVVDNYQAHKSDRVNAELPLLEAADIYVFYLPAYSPESSAIEPIWQDVKYHQLTERSQKKLGGLKHAAEVALLRKRLQLRQRAAETAPLLC